MLRAHTLTAPDSRQLTGARPPRLFSMIATPATPADYKAKRATAGLRQRRRDDLPLESQSLAVRNPASAGSMSNLLNTTTCSPSVSLTSVV